MASLSWQSAAESLFRNAVDEITDSVMRGDDEAAVWVVDALTGFRQELLDTIAGMQGQDGTWQTWRLQGLRQAVDDATVRMQQRYLDAQFRGLQSAWDAGQGHTGGALARAGWSAAGDTTAGVSTVQLEAMKDYSSRLVKHITERARNRIDQELFALSLGAKTPGQAMLAIRDLLNTPDRHGQGYPADLMKQAERVIRTERHRVLSVSTWVRLQQLDELFPGQVQKKWLHGGGGREPRPYHRDVLNGQVLPLNTPFVGSDGTEGMFPHAPTFSAGETINCTCSMVPILPHWSEYDERTGALARRAELRGQRVDEWHRKYPPRLPGETRPYRPRVR